MFAIIWTITLLSALAAGFTHPGLLHTDTDFERIVSKINSRSEPWLTAWNKLEASSYASSSYAPNPASVVYRGSDGTHAENYGQLYRDVAAAYALAIRWRISSNSTYGDAAIKVLDAWSGTLTSLGGNSDLYLAAGIYGYEFAQAGEIMRSYSGWTKFNQFKTMMKDVFYSKVNDWFENHMSEGTYGANWKGVYPGWDLCNMAAAVSIGILLDDENIYAQGAEYLTNGSSNGQINNAIPYWYWEDNQVLAQPMETGRDQGHTMLDVALLSMIGQMAYNQGNDLFATNHSLILAAAEYEAKYNLGYTVPYTAVNNGALNLATISSDSRGDLRPIWELLYNHYGVIKGLNTTWTKQYRDMVVSANGGAEGGSGDYGPNSGGYDQLGWGTLLYTI